MLTFEKMNWREINVPDRKQTVSFLKAGPLEKHGPYLPVGTNVFGATY